MKYTVVLTAEYPAAARDLLAGEYDVVEHPTEHERSEDDMITLLAEADAAITLLSDPLTRRVLEANPNLRMIANYAVGYNNIDLHAAGEAGITVTNTPGVLTEATAELTMALMLALMRRVVEGDREVRQTARCIWEPLHLLGDSLDGKQLGIIGPGRIGQAVAERARAFGMNVVFAGRGESLDGLLESSDVVSIHAPLTAETHHLLDAKALARMRQGSYLINTSRGPIVDEDALCDVLEDGPLRGAALDVYEHEPAVSARLIVMRNVVLAPHIGSATEETRTAMARIAATDVRRFLSGQAPLHTVSA
jgi:glyoxylate reductase